MIEFRDGCDFSKVIRRYPVSTHRPEVLCAISPCTLLYEGLSVLGEVHLLDCGTKDPKPFEGGESIHTRYNMIVDMCATKYEGKELLVVNSYDSLSAFDINTGKSLWAVNGKLPGMERDINACGVTTDGHGRLFVCDGYLGNRCVQIFSIEGQYLGSLLEEGDEGLGEPSGIRWNSTSSSLIVAHRTNYKWFISVIKVT